MNPVAIEQAWADAASPVKALVDALPGTGVSVLPNDKTIFVADCATANHRGGGYWTALMRLQVISPALVKGIMETHNEVSTALSAWLENEEAVNAGFEDSPFELRGFHVQTAGPRAEGMLQISEVNLICGLQARI